MKVKKNLLSIVFLLCAVSVFAQKQILPIYNYTETTLLNNDKLYGSGIDTIVFIADICYGESYTLEGFNENTTGIYEQRLVSQSGDDSIVHLYLTVNPIYNDTIEAVICQGETFNQSGFNETQTGFFTQNLQTIMGCDSIINLNLLVNPAFKDTIQAEICEGDVYNLNGFNADSTGVYEQRLLSQFGCDSTVYLNLRVNPIYLFDTIDRVICKNNPYTDHGLDVDSSGVYTAYLQTINGCDSIYIIRIQVNPVYYDTIIADVYKGNTYNLHGFSENETGIYEQKLQTYLGCDSIIYLDLDVHQVLFPNMVSPNGDGVNDVFTLKNLVEKDVFPENKLIIYNRQGKIIYQKSNINTDTDFWDPQLTNSPNGTYFFRFKGKRHDKELDVTSSIEVLR